MSDEQPRAEWIFPEEKKSNKRRVWLIVGLVVAAIAIVGAALFFFIPRNTTPSPDASGSPSPSPTATATPSASPSAPATPEPDPSTDPVTTPPPVPDPDLATFTAQVQPRLDDAVRGLDLAENNPDAGAQIVESLQNDAAVLSDTPAPSSIAGKWTEAVSQYASTLSELRGAFERGSEPQAELDASRTSLNGLRDVAGI